MKHGLLMLVVGTWLLSGLAVANRQDVDVVLPISPDICSKNAHKTAVQPCNRCCIYQEQNYSEVAVLKIDGEMLQCARDHNVVSTHPLIWVHLKRSLCH
ncbi:DUF1496 domain-containing protein [Serratia symbiotica]|uniref:DUF1496 domain-containing protein n=1 Tax=Serratia symbiotica TaxID=138074 RepID=UPI0030D2C416|nr:DUF1496 domain-containing protein [Serratia symbiotica]